MSRITVRRAPRIPPSLPAGAILVGLGLGLAAGFVLGEVLGPSPAHALANRFQAPVAEPSLRALVDRAKAALDDDLGLRDAELAVVPIGPGRIELHGWVDDRRSRARAARLIADAVRVDDIVNCLRVRGEDDLLESFDETGVDELLA